MLSIVRYHLLEKSILQLLNEINQTFFSNIQMKRWLIRTIVLFYCLTYHRWVRKIHSKMKYSDESKFLFFRPLMIYAISVLFSSLNFKELCSSNFTTHITFKKRSFIQRFLYFLFGEGFSLLIR